MKIDSMQATEYLDVLEQTANAYRYGKRERFSPEIVTNALLQAEKLARQQHSAYQFAALIGQWRLCFTTGVRKLRHGGIALKKGFYLPRFAPAYIGFESETKLGEGKEQISNQIQLNRLKLQFTGPAKFLEKKNLLAFDFTQIQVTLGRRTIYKSGFRGGKAKTAAFADLPISKLPFFAFFLVTEGFIAARGRGGGLAIWIREESPVHSSKAMLPRLECNE